ncbi:MAG: DUF2207 domain-containing protein, partial [Clostridia bacterium]|nr:DUF2207 domain-containing protein [Clostridia bacterium]
MPKFDVYLFCIDICLILCSIKFLQYNKWTETHDDISYPPDPFDSAQAGYILDGYTDDRDIISLLIRWGQLGHLKILVSDGDIYLKKLDKMPKTIPLYERDLFAQLFADSPTVNILELNQKFFVSIAEARRKVDAFFCIPENHIYSLESLAMQRMVSAFLTVPFILCLIATYTKQLEPDSSYDLIAILLVAGLIGLIMTLPVKAFIDTAYHWNSLSSQQKTNKFLFCIVFSIVITGFFLAYTAQELPLLSFLSLGSVILMACLIFFVRKRTPQGQEWAARLLGLKKFIQEASPKTILRLVNEDPHYYFNILPYAYVM